MRGEAGARGCVPPASISDSDVHLFGLSVEDALRALVFVGFFSHVPPARALFSPILMLVKTGSCSEEWTHRFIFPNLRRHEQERQPVRDRGISAILVCFSLCWLITMMAFQPSRQTSKVLKSMNQVFFFFSFFLIFAWLVWMAAQGQRSHYEALQHYKMFPFSSMALNGRNACKCTVEYR